MDYAVEAINRYPDRFVAVVRRLDHLSPDVDVKVRHIRDQAGVLGLRVVFNRDEMFGHLRAGDYDRLWAAASTHGVPIMLHVSGHLPDVVPVAKRYPDLRLLLDHMGLHQPPSHPSPRPFEHLDDLLALSDHPKVAVKISGVASLSLEPYPFSDLWPHLHRVISAFGIQRVAWGSDFTRLARVVTYADSLSFIRHSSELSSEDKQWILGKSIRALLDWPSADVRAIARA
jgi:predicted TIM-barrel fold metal-dependent hydrolase